MRALAAVFRTASSTGARRAASRRALLLAVRPSAERFTSWVQTHAGEVDWPWVVQHAEAHKLLTLLAARLAQAGIDAPLDPHLRRLLFLARGGAPRRTATAERTLATVATAFDDAGLPFFLIKGSALARQVYGDPHLRRFADVDLVVHEPDVPAAEARLAALNYRPGGIGGLLATRPAGKIERARAEALTRQFDRRHLAAHAWDPAPGADLLSIDLHWHVSPARLHVAAAHLWEQTVAVEIGGVSVRTFAPAAMIIHLAAHAATCLFNGFRLLHLVDVAWAATRFADQAAATWQLAEQWRVAPYLALVLSTAERLLEVDLPLTAAPQARRPSRPWIADATAERFLLDSPQVVHRSPVARLWRELAWAFAVGCVHRNAGVLRDAAVARARFRYFRWRQRARTARPR